MLGIGLFLRSLQQGGGAAPVVTPLLWSATDHSSHILISGDKRDASTDLAGGWCIVRVDHIPSEDSCYLEVIAAAAGNWEVGFADADFTLDGTLFGFAGVSAGWLSSTAASYVSGGPVNANAGPAAPSSGDRIMIAWKKSAGKAWLGKNGTWASGDPAAGTAPWITFDPALALYFGASLYTPEAYTLTIPASASHTVPSGFTRLNR